MYGTKTFDAIAPTSTTTWPKKDTLTHVFVNVLVGSSSSANFFRRFDGERQTGRRRQRLKQKPQRVFVWKKLNENG